MRAENKENRKLRLEWVEAGTLTTNPRNWRRHPDSQTRGLQDVLNDPEIGWAGAVLFNETTERLIDGHARIKAVPSNAIIPVLIGKWSEEAEKKILLTLDPLGDLATVDSDALNVLLAEVDVQTESLQYLLANIEANSNYKQFLHDDEAIEQLPVDASGKEFDETSAGDVKTVKCPSCGHEFPQ